MGENIRKEVGNMTQNYTPEFRKKIVRLHEEEGRTYKSITAEYGVSKASICKWCSELRKECQTSEQAKADYNSIKSFSIYRTIEAWQTDLQPSLVGHVAS